MKWLRVAYLFVETLQKLQFLQQCLDLVFEVYTRDGLVIQSLN